MSKALFASILSSVILAPALVLAEVSIAAPDLAENGAIVPVAVTFSPALSKGEVATISVNGQQAMHLLNVDSGGVTKVSSRFNMAKTGNIAVNVTRSGGNKDSAQKEILIKVPGVPGGRPQNITKDKSFKERITSGSYKAIAMTENGFGNTLVLEDSGFKVFLTGSNIVSNSPFIALEGSFSSGARSAYIDAPPRDRNSVVPMKPINQDNNR